ncbi:hypothetical protein BN961_03065 [Afipia felis]|jgi:hypothetical protein|uniref:Uncharacterized protein n=1 Tax=Afipia felis TaxID=1035 RepID=A0A090MQG9_AFIFE|nr:hypothetical protein BN961_03065 [Afipia felis]
MKALCVHAPGEPTPNQRIINLVAAQRMGRMR